MPVVSLMKESLPRWSDVEHACIIRVSAGLSRVLPVCGERGKLFVVHGMARMVAGCSERSLRAGDTVDVPIAEGCIPHVIAETETELVWLMGQWHDPCGGSGVFTLAPSQNPSNSGDPASYERNTAFDNHYHDCDELWVIVSGSGKVVTEGSMYDVGPGDCVLTPAGRHHDFPVVRETVEGVYFESTLKEGAREGHRWVHAHGIPKSVMNEQ